MPRPLLLALTLLAGCTCSPSEPAAPEAPPTEAPPKAAKAAKGAKKPAADKAPADEPAQPVLRSARFRIPLQRLTDDDVINVHAAIARAHAHVKRPEDAAEVTDPRAWKCRKATLYEPTGGDGTPAPLRLFERYDNVDCHAEGAAIEKWEVSMRLVDDERPTDPKKAGGGLQFMFAGEDWDHGGGEWKKGYASFYLTSGGKGSTTFDHDEAWLQEQLPEGLTLGPSTVVDSYRWAIATLELVDEKITIEAERWSCPDKKRKEVGAELVFRTNKRAAGHSPKTPKDVVVTEKVREFADRLLVELGDFAQGPGASAEAARACRR